MKYWPSHDQTFPRVRKEIGQAARAWLRLPSSAWRLRMENSAKVPPCPLSSACRMIRQYLEHPNQPLNPRQRATPVCPSKGGACR